jgi:histone chaperone ASF1
MSIVSVKDVKVLNNPAKFTDPIELDVSFECIDELKEDLEWTLIYVGSSQDSAHDQVLDTVMVGPVTLGTNQFTLTVDAPDSNKIPKEEIESTILLLIGSYNGNKFVQVGYFVHNEYIEQELRENPPATPDVTKLQRNILAEQPRITTFPIDWK